MNLYFIKTLELHDILKSFSVFLSVKNILKLNVEHGVKFEMQILTIIRCGSCYIALIMCSTIQCVWGSVLLLHDTEDKNLFQGLRQL